MSRTIISSAVPADRAEVLSDIDDHYAEADQAALEERADEIEKELICTTEWWSDQLTGSNPTSNEIASVMANVMASLDRACLEMALLPYIKNLHLASLTSTLSNLQSHALKDARAEALERARDE